MDQTKLQAVLDKHITSGKVYNIVASVQSKDGQIDLAGAAGYANADAQTPMTVNTPYFIASITKMYTTTMILKLYEQGRLNLDDPIATYLPPDLIQGIHVYHGEDFSSRITVAQLVSQTSGLADYYEGKPKGGNSLVDELKQGRDLRLELHDMLAITRTMSPKFAPGSHNSTKAHYSDTNFQLLGAIIETITGRSIAENFQQYIFTPLGLQHTYVFNIDQAHANEHPAAFYMNDRPLHMPLFMSSSGPDGGVVSTVADSMTFLRAFFEDALFNHVLFERMTKRWNTVFFPIQYGYGMMRFKLPRIFSPFQPALELIGHSGSTGSFAFYNPAKELYMVGTVNQLAASNRPFQLMMQIANAAKH